MISATFFARWVWPAGGSGGIPGDVVGTLVWVVIAGATTTLVYPPLRRAFVAFLRRHSAEANAELHAKIDHIIKHSPGIPEYTKETPNE